MAGTAWKAVGTILIALGAIAVLLGVGGAVMGGVVANDAASDAGNCRTTLFGPECDTSAEDRMEVGIAMAMAGGGAVVTGLVLLVAGIALVFVGVGQARQAESERLARPPPS